MGQKLWQKLVAFYNVPFVHGAVAAIEGGAISGFLTWSAMGMPLNKQSLIALGGAVGGGIVTALRNYFKNRPNQPAQGTFAPVNPGQ